MRPPFLRLSAWIKDAVAALSASTPTVLLALLKLASGAAGPAGAAVPRRAWEVLAEGAATGDCRLTAKAAMAEATSIREKEAAAFAAMKAELKRKYQEEEDQKEGARDAQPHEHAELPERLQDAGQVREEAQGRGH